MLEVHVDQCGEQADDGPAIPRALAGELPADCDGMVGYILRPARQGRPELGISGVVYQAQLVIIRVCPTCQQVFDPADRLPHRLLAEAGLA